MLFYASAAPIKLPLLPIRQLARLAPASLDFSSLTFDPVRHALMAGLWRLGHEALRLCGPGAVAELRERIMAEPGD